MATKYAMLLLMIAAMAGCSTSPNARREIALLRSEIVDLENQYYALKSLYRDETGREPDFSSFGMSQGEGWLGQGALEVCDQCGVVHDPQIEYDHPIIIDGHERAIPGSNGKPDNLQPPVIEPVEDPDSGAAAGDARPTRFSSPGGNVISNTQNQNRRGSSKPLLDNSSNLIDIEIDSRQTVSYDNDGNPGDDGVAVVIRPIFDGGLEMGNVGELAISVIDPSMPRDTQRLGLWKFSPMQVDSMLRQADGNPMIQVRLPWQNGPARGDSLLIFARVRTVDGRSLEQSSSFPVNKGVDFESGAEEFELESSSDPPITSGSSQGKNQPSWRPIR